MKVGLAHDVPLYDAAAAILREQEAKRHMKQTHVFAGKRPGKPLSEATFKRTMRRLGAGAYTPHGFRSSFRDWAGDTGIEFEIAEQCLAHKDGNAVSRSYPRSSMIQRRRKVMADRAAFLTDESGTAMVVPFWR
jgi:integrase